MKESNETDVLDITKMIKTNINETKKDKKIYLSYFQRLSLFFVLIIILFVFGVLSIFHSLEFDGVENIHFTEKGNVDYKVHVKENDFYDSEYLDKNMSYVASLINDVRINFNYSFVADAKLDFNANYDVIARLIVSDSTTKTNFYDKSYTVSENITLQEKDINHYTINKDVVIDYDYYNDIANNFKSKYNVSTDSYLLVEFKVNKSSNKINLKESTTILSLNIPLSQKAVTIEMNSNNIKNEENIVIPKKIKVIKYHYLVLGIIFIIIGIIAFIKLFLFINKSLVKKSPYDKELSKILKEYDRFISIAKKIPNLEEYKRTDINSFYELLDVRDSVNKVIMFYEITKHQKAIFYLVDGNELYIYTLKAVDVEKQR